MSNVQRNLVVILSDLFFSRTRRRSARIFLYLGYIGELSGERGGGVRIDHLRHRHIDRTERPTERTIDLTINVCNVINP